MEATHCQQVSVLLYNIIIFIYIIHIYVSYTYFTVYIEVCVLMRPGHLCPVLCVCVCVCVCVCAVLGKLLSKSN